MPKELYDPSVGNDPATGFLFRAFKRYKSLTIELDMYEGIIRKKPSKTSESESKICFILLKIQYIVTKNLDNEILNTIFFKFMSLSHL